MTSQVQQIDASAAEGGSSVRKMSEADVPAVVRLHQAAFSDNFMTTFGGRFLRAFYTGLISHPDGYGCVAVDGADRTLGFCAGGTGSVQHIARDMLRRRPLAFALPALLNVLRSPRRIGRMFQIARSYLGGSSDDTTAPSAALLMQIAVAEERRGSGAAQQLVEQFLEEMRSRGATSVSLGVEPDNARAIAFYRRVGFKEVRVGVFEYALGAEMVER